MRSSRLAAFFTSLSFAVIAALVAGVVVGALAMVMYELFSYVEKHTTGWAHRSSNNE